VKYTARPCSTKMRRSTLSLYEDSLVRVYDDDGLKSTSMEISSYSYNYEDGLSLPQGIRGSIDGSYYWSAPWQY